MELFMQKCLMKYIQLYEYMMNKLQVRVFTYQFYASYSPKES